MRINVKDKSPIIKKQPRKPNQIFPIRLSSVEKADAVKRRF
jgi:hypothetical protein